MKILFNKNSFNSIQILKLSKSDKFYKFENLVSTSFRSFETNYLFLKKWLIVNPNFKNFLQNIGLAYFSVYKIKISTPVLECCGAYTEKGMKCLICYGVLRKFIALILLFLFKWNSMNITYIRVTWGRMKF